VRLLLVVIDSGDQRVPAQLSLPSTFEVPQPCGEGRGPLVAGQVFGEAFLVQQDAVRGAVHDTVERVIQQSAADLLAQRHRGQRNVNHRDGFVVVGGNP
jgi:hypothetical protein